jgi:hypothetical protein
VYAQNPSDSGAVHSDVRKRWREGEQEVVDAMARFGDIARQGRFASSAFRPHPACTLSAPDTLAGWFLTSSL